MDRDRFDLIAKTAGQRASRRAGIGLLLAGVVSGAAPVAETDAKRKCNGSKKQCGGKCVAVKTDERNCGACNKKCKTGQKCVNGSCTTPAPPNPCLEKNWCIDRTQTCGAAAGNGKCLIEAFGGNLCAEILFQATSCADCEDPSCVGCRCALAAGGGDRCNNGTNGADFICVRSV